MPLTENNTERGFRKLTFVDSYDENCSIQKSSSAMEDKIWLGIDNPKLTVFENDSHGKYLVCDMPNNFMVSSRMHLTQEMVSALLPVLTRFAETGEL